MSTYTITPILNCKSCCGTGKVINYQPFDGESEPGRIEYCNCVLSQVPKFNHLKDEINLIYDYPFFDNEFISDLYFLKD